MTKRTHVSFYSPLQIIHLVVIGHIAELAWPLFQNEFSCKFDLYVNERVGETHFHQSRLVLTEAKHNSKMAYKVVARYELIKALRLLKNSMV